MELGQLLTRSGHTYPEVSSKVCHDSFYHFGNSVSLPWVIYYEAFYLHVVSSFSCIPVICLKLVFFVIPFQFVYLFYNLSECILLCFSCISSLLLLFFCITTRQMAQLSWTQCDTNGLWFSHVAVAVVFRKMFKVTVSWSSWNVIPTAPRQRKVTETGWPVPDAVITVICAPDDRWNYHPKHVERAVYRNIINCIWSHLVGQFLTLIQDATDPWT